MQQIAQNARERRPDRLQPVNLRLLPPGALTWMVRRPRPLAALAWLFRLLFVEPIGRRAREDRLGTLSDRVLRDIGILHADAHATAWGMVPLQEVLPSYPGDGRVVACASRGHPLTLVRMSEAA